MSDARKEKFQRWSREPEQARCSGQPAVTRRRFRRFLTRPSIEDCVTNIKKHKMYQLDSGKRKGGGQTSRDTQAGARDWLRGLMCFKREIQVTVGHKGFSAARLTSDELHHIVL